MFVEEKGKKMKKKLSDNLVLSQLLKLSRLCQRLWVGHHPPILGSPTGLQIPHPRSVSHRGSVGGGASGGVPLQLSRRRLDEKRVFGGFSGLGAIHPE